MQRRRGPKNGANKALITQANPNGPVTKIKNPFAGKFSDYGSPEQVEEQLGDVWKVFGRDTEAGRALYKMYGSRYKKKINYPKPKTKTWDYKKAGQVKQKPCPQQAKVHYPPVMTEAKRRKREMKKRFAKVDLIPKRKGKHEIMKELYDRHENPYIPINRGVDRLAMTEALQDNNKYANDKKIRGNFEISNEENLKIRKAFEAQLRFAAKQNFFIVVPDRENTDANFGKNVQKTITNPKLRELTGLFDAVVEEIEERQEYLTEIEHLDMQKVQTQIKAEIVERVSELTNINKMIKEEKQKNGK